MKYAVLLSVLVVCLFCCSLPSANSQGTRDTYDFIVVGAGTAGSAVTGELAKKCKKCSILLIEAGGDATDPAVHDTYRQGELLGANYTYLRDDHFTTLTSYHNNELTLSRGKMLGGSMGVNAMFYVIGDPWEWDQTAQDIGDDNWKWSNVAKYREQIEEEFSIYNFGPDQIGGEQYRNAFQAAGWGYDSNIEDGTDGLTSCRQVARLNPNRPGGIRETSFDVKVQKHNFKNVEILTFHRVVKVLIDNNKKAYGVRVLNLRSNFEYDFLVNKEVILSAGAYRTPQILQLSGVGPQALLQQHGIDVVVDNAAVGANLNDHIGMPAYWENLITPTETPILYELPNLLFFGPRPEGQGPQFQMEVAPGYTSVYPLRLEMGGSVQINSADPRDQPTINYPITSVYEDAIVGFVQTYLNPIIEALRAENAVGAGFTPAQPGSTEQEIREWIQISMQGNYHPCSSAKVGGASDANSVVDSHFRVKGVESLRVVDASVHRYMPSGNINAPTLVLGYFAADVIDQDLNLSGPPPAPSKPTKPSKAAKPSKPSKPAARRI